MIEELHPELSSGEGLSGRDWCFWCSWLVDWRISLASWMQTMSPSRTTERRSSCVEKRREGKVGRKDECWVEGSKFA